jgi:hypothetical protein
MSPHLSIVCKLCQHRVLLNNNCAINTQDVSCENFLSVSCIILSSVPKSLKDPNFNKNLVSFSILFRERESNARKEKEDMRSLLKQATGGLIKMKLVFKEENLIEMLKVFGHR